MSQINQGVRKGDFLLCGFLSLRQQQQSQSLGFSRCFSISTSMGNSCTFTCRKIIQFITNITYCYRVSPGFSVQFYTNFFTKYNKTSTFFWEGFWKKVFHNFRPNSNLKKFTVQTDTEKKIIIGQCFLFLPLIAKTGGRMAKHFSAKE